MPYVLPILALLTLLAVWRAGWLRASALAFVPRREVEFSRLDRWVAAGLLAVMFLPLVAGEAVPERGRVGLSIVQALALPIGVVLLLVKAWLTPAGLRKAGLVPRRPGRDLLATATGLPVGVLLTAGTLMLVAAAATGLGYPPPAVNHVMLETLQQAEEAGQIVAIIVSAAVVAPLLEELFFRGLVQTMLLDAVGRRRRWTVVGVAAAVFALIHAGVVSWHALPGLFVLGVVLGWVYERTGSLLPCVLIHAGFNGLNLWAAWEMR